MSTKTPCDTLMDARDLLLDGWTQGAFARNANGNPVPPTSNEAVEFCALGALVHSAGGMHDDNFLPAYYWLKAGVSEPIPRWNDMHEHEDVMAVYSEAIQHSRAEALV